MQFDIFGNKCIFLNFMKKLKKGNKLCAIKIKYYNIFFGFSQNLWNWRKTLKEYNSTISTIKTTQFDDENKSWDKIGVLHKARVELYF
jgi:hypothetical protein